MRERKLCTIISPSLFMCLCLVSVCRCLSACLYLSRSLSLSVSVSASVLVAGSVFYDSPIALKNLAARHAQLPAQMGCTAAAQSLRTTNPVASRNSARTSRIAGKERKGGEGKGGKKGGGGFLGRRQSGVGRERTLMGI